MVLFPLNLLLNQAKLKQLKNNLSKEKKQFRNNYSVWGSKPTWPNMTRMIASEPNNNSKAWFFVMIGNEPCIAAFQNS